MRGTSLFPRLASSRGRHEEDSIMARRRAIQTLTTLLTVATAITLFSAGWVLSSPAVADPGEADVEQVVRAFYAAVDQTIHTGDAASLDAVVDQHVIVHGPLAPLVPDLAGLSNYLLSLHATNPQLDVQVAALTTTSDRAIVELAVQGGEEGTFLGSAVHALAQWGTVDALLVNNHRVLELWTDATGVELQGLSSQVPLPTRTSSRQVIALDRMTFDPGGSFTGTGEDELRWLIGEQFGLSVTYISTHPPSTFSANTSPTSGSLSLDAGQQLLLPPWSRAELRNNTREEVSLLVLTVAEPKPLAARTEDAASGPRNWRPQVSPQGVLVQSLTGEVGTDLPTDDAILALAQATLAPHAELLDLKIAGPCLVVVNSGQLDLATLGRATSNERSFWRYFGRLDAGAGSLLVPCTQVDLHNRGPDLVVLTVIAFLPDNAF
jgi:hypothetical protein